MESILTSIKKLLGLEEDYIQFDTDITFHINTVLMALTQLGIGPEAGFLIIDKAQTWADFLESQTDSLGMPTKVEAVKTYIHLKVRLIFDPPANAFVLESMDRQITELEWRLTVQVEKYMPPTTTTVV